jgi:hypothetical protein
MTSDLTPIALLHSSRHLSYETGLSQSHVYLTDNNRTIDPPRIDCSLSTAQSLISFTSQRRANTSTESSVMPKTIKCS